MTIDLSCRRVNVWDLDNTLCPDEYPGFCLSSYYLNAFMEIVRPIFPEASEERLTRIREEGYRHQGTSILALEPLAEEKGYDFTQMCRKLHDAVNRRWFEIVSERHPEVFDPCPDMVAAFEALGEDIRHGCLSHSSMDGWGLNVMSRRNILQFFEEGALWGMPDYDFISKHLSTRPLEMILEHMGFEPQEAVFIEDSVKNLEKSKELDPKILTVHLHHGRPLDRKPSYIDLSLDNATTLLRAQAEAIRTYKPKLWVPVSGFSSGLVP